MCCLSVMMSVFNETESEIIDAVNSILNQTFSDFELIIVYDNPENENAFLYLESVQKMDDRIVLLKNEINIGLAMSMNRAAQIAKGKYLARMDADDICLPERFAKEVELLDKGAVDFVFTNYTLIDENGDYINEGKPAQMACKTKEEFVLKIVFQSIIHHPTVMMTAEIFHRSGGYRNYPCAQDHDLWLRMLEIGCRFEMIDEILLYYRIRLNSISKNQPIKQHLTIYYATQMFIDRIQGEKYDFTEDDYKRFIKTNISQEKGYYVARNLLTKKTSNKLMKFVYRVGAFFHSSIYRKTYMQKKKYTKVVVNRFLE